MARTSPQQSPIRGLTEGVLKKRLKRLGKQGIDFPLPADQPKIVIFSVFHVAAVLWLVYEFKQIDPDQPIRMEAAKVPRERFCPPALVPVGFINGGMGVFVDSIFPDQPEFGNINRFLRNAVKPPEPSRRDDITECGREEIVKISSCPVIIDRNKIAVFRACLQNLRRRKPADQPAAPDQHPRVLRPDLFFARPVEFSHDKTENRSFQEQDMRVARVLQRLLPGFEMRWLFGHSRIAFILEEAMFRKPQH